MLIQLDYNKGETCANIAIMSETSNLIPLHSPSIQLIKQWMAGNLVWKLS